jgi:hypothetical protein
LSNGFIITGNRGSNNRNIILGLTSQNRSGFNLNSLTPQPAMSGVPGNRWDSRVSGVCLAIAQTTMNNNCNSRMVVDTGINTSFVEFKSASLMGKLKPGRLSPQNIVRVGIPRIFEYSVTPGNRNGFNLWNANLSPQLDQSMVVNSSIAFTDRYDVLYDSVNGQIGFRDRG